MLAAGEQQPLVMSAYRLRWKKKKKKKKKREEKNKKKKKKKNPFLTTIELYSRPKIMKDFSNFISFVLFPVSIISSPNSGPNGKKEESLPLAVAADDEVALSVRIVGVANKMRKTKVSE